MRCIVPNCEKEREFHMFPPSLHPPWLKAYVSSKGCVPQEWTAICSEHIQEAQELNALKSPKMLQIEIVPMTSQDSLNKCDIVEPPPLMVCRICLATDKKLYSFSMYHLKQAYEHLTGISLKSEYRLPQTVCSECAQRLNNCYRFRERMLRANSLMLKVLQRRGQLTINCIQTINRESNQISSPLSVKFYSPDHFDWHGKEVIEETRAADEKIEDIHEDIIVKEEEDYNEVEELDETFSGDFENDEDKKDSKNSHSSECQSNNDKSKLKIRDIKSVNRYIRGLESPSSRKILDNNDYEHIRDPLVKEEVALDSGGCNEVELSPIIVEERLKGSHETKDELQHDYDGDKALSEVCGDKPKVTQKVNNKRKLVNKKEKPVKGVKRKKSGVDDTPDNIVDRHKTTKVKSNRLQHPDETLKLFTITSLSHDQQIQEVLRRKDSSAYKRAPYKCDVCYRGYTVKDYYRDHIIKHSEQSGAHECFICKCRYKTKVALHSHLTYLHTTQYSCNECSFVTRIRSVARTHETWHAGTKYQCPQCSSEFDKLSTYKNHIRIKHVSDCVCELCGYTFVSSHGVDLHKRRTHILIDKTVPLEGPYCEVCELKFASQEAHDRHLKLSSKHTSDLDPKCIRNSRQRMTREALERRRRGSDHAFQGEPLSCEQCGIQLRGLRVYAQHFRRSHPDKTRTRYPATKTPSMCEQCGKVFPTKLYLNNHMWVHTGDKLHKCDQCTKSFTQKAQLTTHMRVHGSTVPSYECPQCGKHFSCRSNRERHMLIHKGLKPHKCDICGKSFTTEPQKKLHFQHVHQKMPWPKRNRQRTSKKRDEPTEED